MSASAFLFRFKIGDQVFDAVKRPLVRQIAFQPFQVSYSGVVFLRRSRPADCSPGDNRIDLAVFPEVDDRCDEDQGKRNNHPVLERDAQKRDPLDQPIFLHHDPRKLLKSYFRGRG